MTNRLQTENNLIMRISSVIGSLLAFTLTQSNENHTLPLALWNYQGQYSSNTAMIMACLTLSVLPMIILFIFMQDKLVKGMMAGAVKG